VMPRICEGDISEGIDSCETNVGETPEDWSNWCSATGLAALRALGNQKTRAKEQHQTLDVFFMRWRSSSIS